MKIEMKLQFHSIRKIFLPTAIGQRTSGAICNWWSPIVRTLSKQQNPKALWSTVKYLALVQLQGYTISLFCHESQPGNEKPHFKAKKNLKDRSLLTQRTLCN